MTPLCKKKIDTDTRLRYGFEDLLHLLMFKLLNISQQTNIYTHCTINRYVEYQRILCMLFFSISRFLADLFRMVQYLKTDTYSR